MGGKVPAKGETRIDRIVQSIRELFEGRSNAVGTVTLRANQTTTTVTAPNCGPETRIFLEATTATAATERGGSALRISSVGSGTFTITHANTADTDKTFFWLALG
jgi:hypothetical protein